MASAPLVQRLALEASAVPPEELAVLDELRQGHLIRMRAAGATHALEIYHDRIRAAPHLATPRGILSRVSHDDLLALDPGLPS